MAIAKATINNVDDNSQMEVMFNPKEYILTKEVVYTTNDTQGTNVPTPTFVHGMRRILYMELFFDSTEDMSDVSEKTQILESYMTAKEYNGETRPPILQFVWGSFTFNCVLESLSQRFTKFSTDGNPLRAIVRACFKEAASESN